MSRSKTAVTEILKRAIIGRLRSLAINPTPCRVEFIVQPNARVDIRQMCIDQVHFIDIET